MWRALKGQPAFRDLAPGCLVGRRPFRELRSLVEKGTEYELEDEDEYDAGTIARVGETVFRSLAICWYQSIDRDLSCVQPGDSAPR
jgi:hypothetical protein